MPTQINKATFQRLIKGDLNWLKTIDRTLERDHVMLIIERCIDHYYPGDEVERLKRALTKTQVQLHVVDCELRNLKETIRGALGGDATNHVDEACRLLLDIANTGEKIGTFGSPGMNRLGHIMLKYHKTNQFEEQPDLNSEG